jgi:hypothetical protein
MKVGDLVKSRRDVYPSKVFLVMRAGQHVEFQFCDEVIWLYPDPDGNSDYDHTDDDNYYFKRFFEVVNESR